MHNCTGFDAQTNGDAVHGCRCNRHTVNNATGFDASPPSKYWWVRSACRRQFAAWSESRATRRLIRFCCYAREVSWEVLTMRPDCARANRLLVNYLVRVPAKLLSGAASSVIPWRVLS